MIKDTNIRVTITITKEEKKIIEQKANEENRTINNLIKTIILKELQKNK